MRKKMGWTAKGIIGMIFAPMGFLFLMIGALVWQSKSAAWKHLDDPVVFISVFGGIGGLFLLLGLAFLLADVRRRHLLQRAYNGGNCVEAVITGVSTQKNVSINGGHPRVLECAWTGPDGVVHIYRSRYLYTDVTKLLKSDTVPVYIDRWNENVGFVDVDAVLPEIRIHS